MSQFYGRRRTRSLSPLLQAQISSNSDNPSLLRKQDLPKLNQLQTKAEKLWFEIGIGSGEHLIALAKQFPQDHFIGAEAFLNGAARALRDANDAKLDNIHIYPEDARDVLAALSDQSLDGLILLFSDPWPKRRHRNRRMITKSLLDEYARLLKIGGVFKIASDHPIFIDWALAHLMMDRRFRWLANSPEDWQQKPDNWPTTRYEQKRLAGAPHYFMFQAVHAPDQ